MKPKPDCFEPHRELHRPFAMLNKSGITFSIKQRFSADPVVLPLGHERAAPLESGVKGQLAMAGSGHTIRRRFR